MELVDKPSASSILKKATMSGDRYVVGAWAVVLSDSILRRGTRHLLQFILDTDMKAYPIVSQERGFRSVRDHRPFPSLNHVLVYRWGVSLIGH